jgi:hypothetical protein
VTRHSQILKPGASSRHWPCLQSWIVVQPQASYVAVPELCMTHAVPHELSAQSADELHAQTFWPF